MNFLLQESLRRIVQLVVGTEWFDFPLLRKIREWGYRRVFPIGPMPRIARHVRLARPHDVGPGRISIGREVLLSSEVFIDYTGEVRVEDEVWISERAMIFSHDHRLVPGRTANRPETIGSSRIELKRGCWIGAGAIILPQASVIGEGAVVGAGSVVTEPVPPKTLVAGNPARIIRKLESEPL